MVIFVHFFVSLWLNMELLSKRCRVIAFTLLTTVCLSASGFAQQTNSHKMSSYVRQAVTDHQQRSLTRGVLDENRMMTAFVCICPEEADAVLAQHHCRKLAQWDDICIASIPLTELEELAMEPLVRRIEANQSNHLCVDTTASIVQALPVYKPSPSHQAYTGKDVVVGLVDIGFDLTHPNFLDTDGRRLRIGAFWDQLSRDTIGSAMPVGRDYLGPEAIHAIRQSVDAPSSTHGTHTLGIAAGSGFDTPYRGIAWDSDLCVVANAISTNIEYVDSVDYYKYTTAIDALAFKYCFDYAEQQGKSCVVSFSEGYAPYLDDEDSLFAVTLEQLTGPGRIIVAAAGNEGVEKTYFEKTENQMAAGSFVRSFKETALYRIKSEGEMSLVVYGYRKETGIPSDTIAFETAEVPIDTVIKREMMYGQDSLTVKVYRDLSRFSDHDIWQVLLESNRTIDKLAPLAVVVEGRGRIEAYGNSTNAFRDHRSDGRWTAAFVGRNVFAPGCFPGIICVGATTHRLSIQNAEGLVFSGSEDKEAGKIGYYSSTGPAMNDLLKPDVVAPGTNVVSSYSSLYHPKKEVVGYSDYEGERYPWGVNTGTSMSTPVVAGVIALWLQAKPDLTPQDVREVMQRSCRHPEASLGYPNEVYGYGEIDAYRGLLEVLSLSGVEGISLHQPSGVLVTPMDGGLRLVFDRVVTEPVMVRVYNLSGACIQTCQLMMVAPEVFVPLSSTHSGIYAVQVETSDRSLEGSTLVRF